MELAGLLLLILLPPEDATGDTAVGIKASLHQAFGEVAMAVAPDTLVTPVMWRGEKSQMRARFVAHLTWEQKNQARVELLAVPARVGGPESRRVRRLNFDPRDNSDSERGRAIGLVIAEMMREWPSSAWTDRILAPPPPPPPPVAPAVPPRIELGGMLVTERVASGLWATGPKATYGYGLDKALWLQASGTTLFASDFNYIQVGFGLSASWRFLRWEGGRHAVGVGVAADLLRESASSTVAVGDHAPGWDAAFGAKLAGRASLGRSLRVTSEINWRATSSPMTLTSGVKHPFARWRPSLAVGLELAF